MGGKMFLDHRWIDFKYSAVGGKVCFYTMLGLSYDQYSVGYRTVWDTIKSGLWRVWVTVQSGLDRYIFSKKRINYRITIWSYIICFCLK